MSCLYCEDGCGTLIDTDLDVESWREEAGLFICEGCWRSHDKNPENIVIPDEPIDPTELAETSKGVTI